MNRLTEDDARLIEAWLAEECDVQEELRDALDRTETLIRANDSAELEAHLESSEPLLSRLERIAARRTKVLPHVLRRAGLEAGETTSLDPVLDALPEDHRGRAAERRERARDLARDVDRRNRRTRVLVDHGLALGREIVRCALGHETTPPDGPLLDQRL